MCSCMQGFNGRHITQITYDNYKNKVHTMYVYMPIHIINTWTMLELMCLETTFACYVSTHSLYCLTYDNYINLSHFISCNRYVSFSKRYIRCNKLIYFTWMNQINSITLVYLADDKFYKQTVFKQLRQSSVS